jgi:hypothetical protein
MTPRELTWMKSSYSIGTENGNCVEVAITGQATAVRDSKAPADGQLAFGRSTWGAFLAAVSWAG